jgi:hypothetical protein
MLDLTWEGIFCCLVMVYFCTSLDRELVELHLDNCASNTTYTHSNLGHISEI